MCVVLLAAAVEALEDHDHVVVDASVVDDQLDEVVALDELVVELQDEDW